MDENRITLRLSEEQRSALVKYQKASLDPDLARLLCLSLKKGDTYEFYLTEEQLEELHYGICTMMSEETNHRVLDEMQDLCNCLEDHMPGFTDEEEDEDEEVDEYSEYSKNTGTVYVLKVALEGAKRIWRRIAIRGGQTLHDLHDSIYMAFDRDDEHMYSFYFSTVPSKSRTRKVMRNAKEYTHPFGVEESGIFETEAENAATTSIESLKLKEKQKVYYLFDFGDSWWHEITVEEINGTADEGTYPRIIEKKGQSPPQYQYDDEEDEDEEWDESEDDAE